VEYRDWSDIEEIPDMLKNAFIAVEDVRFYKHSGVDFKRLFSAALEILGNSNSSGGSTITQQLIKNKILGSQRNYKRKIQEAYLALELETIVDKDTILEAYLNDVDLGESNYGVRAELRTISAKNLELTVRECAMLAGLTQARIATIRAKTCISVIRWSYRRAHKSGALAHVSSRIYYEGAI
jgi:penicillin-binding protein 1A